MSASRHTFAETAARIGWQICEEAVWHEGRCNWIGAMSEEGTNGQPVLASSALGPHLYAGTSGVAIFLAHAHALTGEPLLRETALGAIRQALSSTRQLPSSLGGLYVGRVGIALAAAWTGRILSEDEMMEAGLSLAGTTEPFTGAEFDVISGRAGALVGLLTLAVITGERAFLDQATCLGEELLESAKRTDAGLSWTSVGFPSSGNLTGFSHGAAGAGYALLELHRATDDRRYAQAAQHAFAYERALFDTAALNWPDLRSPSKQPFSSRNTARESRTFGMSWCHGAPGIGLSRLRACELLHDEASRSDASLALETTSRAVQTTLSCRVGNYSLCHGLSGNAEILLAATDVLGLDDGSRALALGVADAGIERHARSRRPWPCGIPEGETPNLFLGLSGIGLFYLRLYDPGIPSFLAIHPEAFDRP